MGVASHEETKIKNDIIKLCSVTRRPEYTKQSSIRAWEYIIEIISICSVFSNLIFIYIYNQRIWKSKFSLFTFTVFEHFKAERVHRFFNKVVSFNA